MINYSEMGKRIRIVRKSRNLTQEEAAERCDVTASFYGNIERGEKAMSLETLAKVSKGLTVSADYIMFGEEVACDQSASEFVEFVQKNSEQKKFEKYMEIIKTIAAIIDKL